VKVERETHGDAVQVREHDFGRGVWAEQSFAQQFFGGHYLIQQLLVFG